jgi:hypothetical protein
MDDDNDRIGRRNADQWLRDQVVSANERLKGIERRTEWLEEHVATQERLTEVERRLTDAHASKDRLEGLEEQFKLVRGFVIGLLCTVGLGMLGIVFAFIWPGRGTHP